MTAVATEFQRRIAAIPPVRRLLVHFACNDGRNGLFAGMAEGCSLQGRGWTLDLDGEARFTVDHAKMKFCIHRQWFPFVADREWVGNWCWNAYSMKRPQALRLMHALARNGWSLSGGDTRICQWWDALSAPSLQPGERQQP